MKVKIKSYSGELPYLNPEKEYEAICVGGDFFVIETDRRGKAFCKMDDCIHLNGGSWEIVTESHTSHV